MRLLLAAAILALSACGEEAATPAKSDQSGGIQLTNTGAMPDWLLIARTPDGGYVHFNQRAITRSAGTADIWVQVRHARDQLYQTETETTETVVHYQLERLHYRFNCAEETFTVTERQILGANEQVIARETPETPMRATPERGAARIALPIACRGG